MKHLHLYIISMALFSAAVVQVNAQQAPGLYGQRLFVEFGVSVNHNSTGIRFNERNYAESRRVLAGNAWAWSGI